MPPQLLLPSEEIVLDNVAYGIDNSQKMDVYLPKNRNEATKTIIYLHGGGWYLGNKEEIREGAIYFQQHGFAFVSIGYRLTRTAQNNIHPAQMDDIASAVNMLISQKTTWGISGTKLCCWGGSAGAHLAMLYGYKYNTDKKIKAIISTSGPTDLTNTTLINSTIGGASIGGMIESYIGQPFAANPQAWRDASPVFFINGQTVPTMFIHGTVDSAVPFAQSQSAFQQLQNAGVASFLEPLANVGHDLVGTNWADLLPKIITFVNTYAE